MANEARKLLEKVDSIQMDEALRNTKKKLRETLDKDKESGSRGMRALAEVMKERGMSMLDEQDDSSPIPKNDSDKKMLNEVMGNLGKDIPKLKKMQEVSVGLSTQERPKDKQGDVNKADQGKQDPAFKGSDKPDLNKTPVRPKDKYVN